MRTHFLPEFGSRVIADLATDEGEVALLDCSTGSLSMSTLLDGAVGRLADGLPRSRSRAL
jgi:hypothetical protein